MSSWFSRHLNWTFALGLLAILLIVLGTMPLHLVMGEMGETIWFLIFMFGMPLALLTLTIWVLKQKGRSLAHLLWFFLGGIGIIIILCLQNRAGNRVAQEAT